MRAIMMECPPATSSISGAELLRSELLSTSVFTLQHEATSTSSSTNGRSQSPQAAGSNGNGFGIDDDESKRRRTVENAVRIALLLTRSFVAITSKSKGTNQSQDDAAVRNLSEVGLSDIFINLERTKPNNNDGGGLTSSSRTSQWTLLGVDVTLSPRRTSTQYYPPPRETVDLEYHDLMSRQMRILGKLLYSIFSLNEFPPPDLFGASETANDRDVSEDAGRSNIRNNNHHSSKLLRAAEISLFSKLTEVKKQSSSFLPLSVCRLLSDLVDTGPKGKAHDPFASYEDVVRDLEQMIAFPRTFLHDVDSNAQCNNNGPRGGIIPQCPVFGQIYHGRNEELATLMKAAIAMQMPRADDDDASSRAKSGVESVFVSGIAGSGKSALVQTVGDRLNDLGWIVVKSKFERNTEHASRGIISSMFDKVISHLATIKEQAGGSSSSPSDIDYIKCVEKSIMNSIGLDGLNKLVVFLPSLPELFDNVSPSRSISPGDAGKNKKSLEQVEVSNWQLVYALSKILEAVLEHGDRFIMICCDDLQWADRTSLSFITEVLINVGGLKRICRRCLFVGLFREDEVGDEHPFSIQLSYLQMSSNVNTSDIKLSSLSKEDVAGMLVAEFRLPRRIVLELADVVYKKTAGHAIFVVKLLNSLIADSIIAYSSEMRRYAWDPVSIDCIQTGESVAELIASNFSLLAPELQRNLRILSCFGTQTDGALLRILDRFQPGLVASVDTFVEEGILDRAGPIVIFTHDLITQAVYESLPPDRRKALHLEIGIFLGTTALTTTSMALIKNGMGKLELSDRKFYAGRNLSSTLIAIACDAVNLAGPDAVGSEDQRLKFAEWNLSAGGKTSRRSNFRAAFYYFSKGIEFLGEDCWNADPQLCLELYDGAILSSFALGERDTVISYADEVVKHAPFEDSLLAHQFSLRAMTTTGDQEECISKGIGILRQLGIDIPLQPSRESVMKAMSTTNALVSQYNWDQIMNLYNRSLDESVLGVVKIMQAFFGSCYSQSSPFLPLITCEMVKYSIQYGICEEASTAFASYGTLKVALEGDHKSGRHWATVVKSISEKSKGKQCSTAHFLLYVTIEIWFSSARELSANLLEHHQNCIRLGEIDYAVLSLDFAWRYKLLGGEKLSLITQTWSDRYTFVRKYNYHNQTHKKSIEPYARLDAILLEQLTGTSNDFEGLSFDINEIQAEAESKGHGRLLHHVHFYRVMLGFWQGDREGHISAEKFVQLATTSPNARKPEIPLIYLTFFGALVSFHLYRESGGNHRLKAGREMMDKMRGWTYVSMSVFENKWLLLKAEYLASFKGSDDAEKVYEASIKASRDNGNIHELGLAYQLLGGHYASRELTSRSVDCYQKAYTCYTQWGANAVAKKLASKHNLDTDASATAFPGKSKHSREWD